MVGDVVDASKSRGAVGRRCWSDEIKGRIVAESFAPGAVVSDVARRHGLSPQHLSAWRCATRAGLLKLPADVEMPAGSGMSTMRRARASSSGQVCGALGSPGPRHELVETRSRPEIDQPGENIGQISLRVDATEFAGLDERGDAGPILRALIMPGEERILAIENNRADASFDDVGVELDAAVVEEPREAVPMVQGVADVLGDGGLGRDASELLLEPGLECRHERLAALLAHRAALIGTAAPERLLDGIQGGNARERLAGDRRGTALRDVVEAAPQMGPAKSQGDCLLAFGVGNGLVGRVPVALHDAAIAIEQLERMHCAATGSVGVGDRRRIGPAPGPIVARDRPEEALLGAAASGIEYWRRGLVDRDLARGENDLAQPQPERLELRGRIAHPERQN